MYGLDGVSPATWDCVRVHCSRSTIPVNDAMVASFNHKSIVFPWRGVGVAFNTSRFCCIA